MRHSKFFYFAAFLIQGGIFSPAYGGGFDNSGRDFGIIFDNSGKENEFRYTYQRIQPQIDGKIERSLEVSPSELQIPNTAPDYDNAVLALRVKINDHVSCAARHEKPFYTDVRYPDDRFSYTNPSDSTPIFSALNSSYDSESLTLACRYSWNTDNQRFHVFFGPKHQQISGSFSSDLTPLNVGSADNLDVYLDGHSEWGYIAGAAFEYPEIAARVALIYHNEIHYNLEGQYFVFTGDLLNRTQASAMSETITPQSVHLTMESGIAPKWLLFSSLKWSEWSKVDEIIITPDISLSLFSNDTLDLDLGLIHAFSDTFQAGFSYNTSLRLGSEDNPPGADGVDMRNPQGQRHTLTTGGKYWFNNKLALDLTLGYTWLEKKVIVEQRQVGDAYTATFDPANALSSKIGISIHF